MSSMHNTEDTSHKTSLDLRSVSEFNEHYVEEKNQDIIERNNTLKIEVTESS